MFKNYPQGYSAVFWTEFWGIFAFYGLRSVLILYLVNQFSFSDPKAFELYGVFMALAYLTPVLGGVIADQILGIRQTLLLGSLFVFIGCLFLSIPNEMFCFLGLSLVCVGTGLFKPTILSSVGNLFSKKESHLQDSAYTTFYIGMSLGSFIAANVCGWLGQTLGWGRVFPLVAATMGFGTYLFYQGIQTHKNFQPPRLIKNKRKTFTWIGILLSTPLFYVGLSQAHSMQWVLPSVLFGSLGCLTWIFLQSSQAERKDVLQLGLLMILFSIFCSLFEQTGSSVTLFIERSVNRELLNGFVLPTPFFQSLLPACIILLSPLMAFLWRKLAALGKDLNIFEKFTLGFLFVSINYWIFVFAIDQAIVESSLVSPWWVVLGYIIHVIGDLCIVPIGFAAVAKLAPRRFLNMLMGLWMVSIAFSHYVSSLLAKLSSIPCSEEERTFLSTLEIYQLFFKRMAIIPLAVVLATTVGIIFTRRFILQKRT